MLPISVILPVYIKVDPREFERALLSLQRQTEQLDEIIVVFDGPVQPAVEALIAAQDPQRVTLVRFDMNQGLAAGLRAAMAVARNRWIGRQDADDISLPERFARQWQVVQSGEYAAVGAAMFEFDEVPENVVRERRLPCEPEQIARYVKLNNPMNHPTVIFDGDAVREVGGVHNVHLMEDYDLFARLIAAGYRLRNLPEPLVFFNAGEGMFQRRTGKEMARAERLMQRNLLRYGLVSRPRAAVNFAIRQGFRMLPKPLLKRVYRALFDRERR